MKYFEQKLSDDPREVGKTYRSHYWHDTYTVLDKELVNGTIWLRVRWSDGHTTYHCTAYDPRDNRVE